MITSLTVFVFMSVQEAIKIMEFLDYEGLKQYHSNLQTTIDTALQSKADVTKIVNQAASESEVTIQPNVMNVWGEVTSLNITKGTDISGIVNNYMVRFKAGEGCDVNFLGFTLQWFGGNEPTWTAGNTYEISIVDDIALWAEFEPKQA